MSTEIAPATKPDDDDQHARDSTKQNSEHPPRRGQRRAGEKDSPSREGGLLRAWKLPKLIALKLVSPAQANAMSRAIGLYLDHSDTSQSGASMLPDNDNILARLRDNPDLLELFEPFLSDEDVARVMGTQDDSQPET